MKQNRSHLQTSPSSPAYITLNIPGYIISHIQRLLQAGFSAYLVGGALRDTLLNKPTDDYDIATNALPSEVKKVFPNAKDVGIAFGTVVVPIYLPHKNRYVNMEITTLRTEKGYSDHRHPDNVSFVSDIKEDLKRRDFTINAMAVDLVPLKDFQLPTQRLFTFASVKISFPLIDPYKGLKDLEAKKIRAVGSPLERFKEDPLRAFRACRFKAQLEFELDPETAQAIPLVLELIPKISRERIQTELVKLLTQADNPSIGLECMRKTGLLRFVIPELLDCVGVEQPIGHAHDVYWHLLYSTDKAPKKLEVRLAALLHDIGKPQTKRPDGHFYGHDQVSAEMAYKILKRLKFSNRIISKVTSLIRWHMFFYPNYLEDTIKDSNPPSLWSDAAVRRFIQRVGLENIDDLFSLRIADATSNPKAQDPYPELKALKKHIEKVLSEDAALKRSDLKITGHDLIKHLKLKPGPIIGQILDFLLEQVIVDPTLNTKTKLLALAQSYLNNKVKGGDSSGLSK